MSRPVGTKPRKEKLTIRLRPAAIALLKERARSSGMTVSAYAERLLVTDLVNGDSRA